MAFVFLAYILKVRIMTSSRVFEADINKLP